MRSRLTPEMRAAIEAGATEAGIDPSVALAIAERESSFNPAARNSKTIRGLYQMRGDHRANYGIGDSDDPGHQTKGWAAFFKDVKREMAGQLGRDPSDAEGYLGHHFGGARAGRMMGMDPNTPVGHVFNGREMAENPHFARAGTVGRLNSSILADIERRQARYGGQAPGLGLIDFASASDPVEKINMASQPAGGLAELGQGAASPASAAAPDFSQFGVPA
jgi:hypothetical protein